MHPTSDLRNPRYVPYDGQALYKRELRRRGSAAGFAVLISFGMMNFVASFVMGVLMGLGVYDLNQAAGPWQGVTDQVAYYLMYGVYATLAVVPVYLLALKLSGVRADEVFLFQKVGVKKHTALIVLGLGGSMFANMMTVLLGSRLSMIGIPQSSVPSPSPTGLLPTVLFFIDLCVIPAIMEELAFRGAVLGLLRKFGDGFAVLVSSILFGLMHGNLVQIPFAFIVGLILGYLVVRTNSLLPAILLHFANNFYSCLMQMASQYLTADAYTAISYGSMLLFLIVGFFAMRYLLKREKDFFAVRPAKDAPPLSQRLKTCFSSVGILAIVILLSLYTLLVTVMYA